MDEQNGVENGRLLTKGQRLFERYCQKDDMACVTGFVAHQLKREDGRFGVVEPFLAYLKAQEQREQVVRLIEQVEGQLRAQDEDGG